MQQKLLETHDTKGLAASCGKSLFLFPPPHGGTLGATPGFALSMRRVLFSQ